MQKLILQDIYIVNTWIYINIYILYKYVYVINKSKIKFANKEKKSFIVKSLFFLNLFPKSERQY